jgi:hypothetical protein
VLPNPHVGPKRLLCTHAKVRRAFRHKCIANYWYKRAGERHFAPGEKGAIADIATYTEQFVAA